MQTAPMPLADARIASLPPLGDKLVRKLWTLMTDALGYNWTDQHGVEDAGGTWARGLAGLRGEDIARGMARFVASGAKRAPGLPEFRALCEPQPEQVGAPAVDRAYAEACRNAHPAAAGGWSHPAVYHAATAVGLGNLLRLSPGASSARFQREYLAAIRVCVDVGSDALRQPPEPDRPRLVKLADPATAARELDAMRLLLKGVRHGR